MTKKKYAAKYDLPNARHVIEDPAGEVIWSGQGYDASRRAEHTAQEMNNADRAVRRLAAWEKAHPEALRRKRRGGGGRG